MSRSARGIGSRSGVVPMTFRPWMTSAPGGELLIASSTVVGAAVSGVPGRGCSMDGWGGLAGGCVCCAIVVGSGGEDVRGFWDAAFAVAGGGSLLVGGGGVAVGGGEVAGEGA